MSDPGPDHGPAGHRGTPWSVMAVAPYRTTDRAATDAQLDSFDAALARSATGGSFLTLLTQPERTHTAFTAENFARLRDLKAVYDPDRFFRPSHTIHPASPDPHVEGELP